MTDRISPQAAAAREAARHATGEFGAQAHTPPESGAGWEPKEILAGVTVLQESSWGEHVEVGVGEFRLDRVLDTMPLDDVEELREWIDDGHEHEGLYRQAVRLGLAEPLDDDQYADEHIDPDDLVDYIARRRAAGLEGPLARERRWSQQEARRQSGSVVRSLLLVRPEIESDEDVSAWQENAFARYDRDRAYAFPEGHEDEQPAMDRELVEDVREARTKEEFDEAMFELLWHRARVGYEES